MCISVCVCVCVCVSTHIFMDDKVLSAAFETCFYVHMIMGGGGGGGGELMDVIYILTFIKNKKNHTCDQWARRQIWAHPNKFVIKLHCL